jgi:tRNA (mo5U34)-methyltransferase
MDTFVRFSGLVRKGLRFRRKFEQAKTLAGAHDFDWYPYDCFANLFYVQHLLHDAGLSLAEIIGGEPVLDIGAADGALSFFLESLGYRVEAWDNSGTNMNRMQGLRSLARSLGSQVHIQDVDLDGRFEVTRRYGAALFLGTLYHLKNPFYALETLARHARFCFLSTRVARWSPDREVRLEHLPVAYLLDADECNADATNYWIFSPPGLTLLARRAGWQIRAAVSSGSQQSDPQTREGDERMFLLLSKAS